MKIVAIISQKGGAGKTTLAVHLATAAALAGHTSAIIDLDPQATAASWGDRRTLGAPEVISGQAARLPALITSARQNGADFLVLDTAPNADQVVSLAARAADLVLIPCRAAAFDLEAIETTLMLAKAATKPAFVVLNAVPPRSGIGKEAATGVGGARRSGCPPPTHAPSRLRSRSDRRTHRAGVRAAGEGRRGNRGDLHVAMWCCGHVHTWTQKKGGIGHEQAPQSLCTYAGAQSRAERSGDQPDD